MIDKFEHIRNLLTDLENDVKNANKDASLQNFNALEIPAVVAAIVDYLQPALLPYENAIYWHLFRHSILETGQQYSRVSVRGLANGVITSSRSDSLSYRAVQEALQGLEAKSVISKVGDTNREGTLYKIMLPEEIPCCQERMKQDSVPERGKDLAAELDYYNIPENRNKVFERDGYKCYYCGKQLTRFSAALDHLQPVSKGGDNSFGNLITSCLHCNSRRGNRPVMDIISET